jgi:hypothetical protein
MATKTQQKHSSVGQQSDQNLSRLSAASEDGKVASRASPQHERIQARAYEIFQKRKHNGQAGDQVNDWLQAEREIADSQALSASLTEAKAPSREENRLAEKW